MSGEPYERMDEDVARALYLLHEAAQCIDRVHRAVFINGNEWQEAVMALADKSQRHVRHARRAAEKIQVIRRVTKDRSPLQAHGTRSPN